MCFAINRLIGYIEEIEGSSDKYLVVAKSVSNKKIVHSFDIIWGLIEKQFVPNNFNNKRKDYDKLKFNFDIDLPLDTLIEFRSLVVNVNCVIEKIMNIIQKFI